MEVSPEKGQSLAFKSSGHTPECCLFTCCFGTLFCRTVHLYISSMLDYWIFGALVNKNHQMFPILMFPVDSVLVCFIQSTKKCLLYDILCNILFNTPKYKKTQMIYSVTKYLYFSAY